MKQAIKLLRNRSGQAMVEYILVLIIGVTLLFAAKGFFENVDKFMTGYIGGYFKCLMVHGELPALGVQDSDLTKHQGSGYKCKIEFTKTGAVAGTGGNDGGSGGTKSGGGSQNESDPSSRRSSRSGSGTAGESSRGSYGSTKMGRGGKGAFRSASVRRSGQGYGTTDSDSSGGDSVKYIKSPTSNRSERANGRKIASSTSKSDVKKLSEPGSSQQLMSSVKRESGDEQIGPKAKKIIPKLADNRGVASASDEDEGGFTLGNLFKWVMMAGLGIILFILFGSQIMSYNNSDSD